MWKEILNPYELAVEELQVKFNHMVKEYRQAGIYSPIEQVLEGVNPIPVSFLKPQRWKRPTPKFQQRLITPLPSSG